MTVDPNTLKEGDIVHVRATVLHRASGMGAACWTIEAGSGVVTIRQSQIVHVEPRPLKTNDTCIDKVTGWRGKIAAVDGSEAWVRWGREAPDAAAMRPTSEIMLLRLLERAEG